MNDIAFKVIIKNDGIDDVIFKTLMLKGEKGDKGDAGGAEIDDSTTSASKTWSSNKIRNEIDAKPVNLSQLGDVDLDTITDGQMLGYNLTAGKWENKTADASTLKYDANTTIKSKIDDKADSAGLSLVAVSGDYGDLSNKPQLADVATSGDYDDLSNKPTIPDELNDMTDVDISGQTSGEALVWDGTKWTNGSVSSVGSIDDLSDVDTTGKSAGDCLRYDGSEWISEKQVIELTQAEYDALQSKQPNTLYVITDAQNLNPTADDIEFSAGVSVADAIDEKAVIESGSNNNGYYVKYSDGTMICTKTAEFSVAVSEWQAWGTCYETPLKDCGVWAMNFISNPVVSATQTGGAGWLEYFYDTDNTNVGKTRFVRPSAPGATVIYKMNIIGVGRWKA